MPPTITTSATTQTRIVTDPRVTYVPQPARRIAGRYVVFAHPPTPRT